VSSRPTDSKKPAAPVWMPPTAEKKVSVEELREGLLALFRSPSYRPPMLPTVAAELLALSQRANVDFDAVASLLKQDTLLAGRTLMIANSALYRGTMPLRSIKQALVRLGLNCMRDLVLEAALSIRIFHADDYVEWMDAVRLHNIAVAHISREIARHRQLDPELAFLCGLFHDVGLAACVLLMEEMPRHMRPADMGVVWPAMHEIHEEISAMLTRHWQLPAELVAAVGHHHDYTIDGVVNPMAAVVGLADLYSDQARLLAHRLGDSGYALASERKRKEAITALQFTAQQAEVIDARVSAISAWLTPDQAA
jgi:putative nucleotidyltransferase with HDIG domain